MQIEQDSLLVKKIVVAEGSEIDKEALSDVKRIANEVASACPTDTIDILTRRNKDLFEILCRAESIALSFVYLVNKPTQIKKQFSNALKEYQRVGRMCEQYAKRHSVRS